MNSGSVFCVKKLSAKNLHFQNAHDSVFNYINLLGTVYKKNKKYCN